MTTQAIEIKIVNPSATRGVRVKASFDGVSITLPYDYANNNHNNACAAAMAIVEKLGLHNDLIIGIIRSGYYVAIPTPWEK